MKLLKRNLDETEEELQKEKTQKRKYQRECEDMIESQEAMNREINSLKTKLRYVIKFLKLFIYFFYLHTHFEFSF